jgi:hypothetical protein
MRETQGLLGLPEQLDGTASRRCRACRNDSAQCQRDGEQSRDEWLQPRRRYDLMRRVASCSLRACREQTPWPFAAVRALAWAAIAIVPVKPARSSSPPSRVKGGGPRSGQLDGAASILRVGQRQTLAGGWRILLRKTAEFLGAGARRMLQRGDPGMGKGTPNARLDGQPLAGRAGHAIGLWP